MIEMTVQRVGLSEEDVSPVIVLRERFGDRCLQIKVSTLQANAAMRHSHRIPPFRPQTHETLVNMLAALGAKLRTVSLAGGGDELTGTILLDNHGEGISLPAGAGDAVVLALRAGAPIFVSPAVMQRLGRPEQGGQDRSPHGADLLLPSSLALPSVPERAARSDRIAERPPLVGPPDVSSFAKPDVFRDFVNGLSSVDDIDREQG